MLSGNVLHNTQFKLFRPVSRNGQNEVIGVNIIKNLGFIAPDTFNVDVFINDFHANYIFQEELNKNFLEKNSLRETLILQTDQKLDFNQKYPLGYFEEIRSATVKNDKIFSKNRFFYDFGIFALSRLNKSYYKFNQSDKLDRLISNPNLENENISKWNNFNLLMLALGAEHSTNILNRIVVYDILEDDFVPIYYDGNITLPNLKSFNPYENTLKQYITRVSENDILFTLNSIRKLIRNDDSIYLKNLEKIYLFFLEKKQNYTKCCNYKERDLNDIEFKKFLNYKGIKQNFFHFQNIKNDSYLFKDSYNKNISIDQKNLYRLFVDLIFENKRSIIIESNSKYKFDTYKSLNSIDIFSGRIYHDKNTYLNIDYKDKTINISSYSDFPLILFYKNNFPDDWKIINRSYALKSLFDESPGMNRYGFTGCINFYKVEFNNNSLESNYSNCEDSINILNSSGKINTVSIANSRFDSLDIDFSNLKISEIVISNAGNDCLDLSWGNYQFKNITTTKCGDKGLSVGEASNTKIKNLSTSLSNIGVASKDSSKTFIENFYGNLNNKCYVAYNKKEEFFDSLLKVYNHHCNPI